MTRTFTIALGLLLASSATLAEPLQTSWPTNVDNLDHDKAMALFQPSMILRTGAAPQQKIEIFLPSGKGAHPVVVYIHGGCYVSRYGGGEEMRPVLAQLANRGIAVWSVSYRLTDQPGGSFPGLFEDVGAAIDRLPVEAAKLNIDMNRVVFVGHSAGAHLALWAAGRPNIPPSSPLHAKRPLKPRAVVAADGPGELAPLEALADAACGPGTFERLVGKTDGARPDRFADTSPDRLLPLRMPVHLLVGENDQAVPPPMVQQFAQKAEAAGDKVTFKVIAGADHLAPIDPTKPAFAETLAAIEAALR